MQSYVVEDGMVRDTATGLVWEQVLSAPLSALEASEYCAAQRTGGLTHWRLPEVRELPSLFRVQDEGAQIDLAAFPGTPAEPFWTATPVDDFSEDRWVVDFGGEWSGAVRLSRTEGIYPDPPRVRCVRRG